MRSQRGFLVGAVGFSFACLYAGAHGDSGSRLIAERKSKERPLIVIFGRPGAGKTTVANAVLDTTKQVNIPCQGLDLDVCVPQWMRDNFAKGIYPTLAQRQAFAHSACEYVDDNLTANPHAACLVSFSFVNKDLRDIFRSRFPSAQWFLLDTSFELAEQRIAAREGHFYKNVLKTDTGEKISRKKGSEWSFAPVDYPHTVLDGAASVSLNAQTIFNALKKNSESSE
eukprot:g10544.t1